MNFYKLTFHCKAAWRQALQMHITGWKNSTRRRLRWKAVVCGASELMPGASQCAKNSTWKSEIGFKMASQIIKDSSNIASSDA
jgi:hypothetical protein